MAKATADGVVLPVSAPTIATVRKAMAEAATATVAAKQAKARPGVKWSWTWGSRGVQYSVQIEQPRATAKVQSAP